MHTEVDDNGRKHNTLLIGDGWFVVGALTLILPPTAHSMLE